MYNVESENWNVALKPLQYVSQALFRPVPQGQPLISQGDDSPGTVTYERGSCSAL